MKITDVQTFIIHAHHDNWVITKVYTDEGVTGIGESSVEGREFAVKEAIAALKPYLIGQNPFAIEKHYYKMYRDAYWGAGALLSGALSAVDGALWDIKAKALNVPVYELLGGKMRDSVRVYANRWFFGANTPEQLAEKAAATVKQGFTALKWDPFGKAEWSISNAQLKQALAQIQAVRETVGDEVDILIEGHGRFDIQTAIRIAKELEPYKPMFFEEPVMPENIDALAEVRFDNFTYLFYMPDFTRVIWNTIYIAVLKIVAGLVFSITFALLINEVKRSYIKRSIQTAVYLPHFLSWVILGAILIDILSPSSGVVNGIMKALGFEPIFFLGDAKAFPLIIVITDVWKEFGFATIIYLAAISSINPNLYEAAAIDGAGRFKKIWYVTLPSMMPIIILMATLALGNVLNAGFDQIFNLYSPVVYRSGDIIDTFVYRLGLQDLQYSVAAVAGLFKSVVGFILIVASYWLAYRFANYRIF